MDDSIIAVIPIRSLSNSKGRLRLELTKDKARILFDDLIEEIFRRVLSETSRAIPDTCVVSSSLSVLSIAKQENVRITVKDEGVDLNQALTTACRECEEAGWGTTMVLMADLPLLNYESIASILDVAKNIGVQSLIVPSKTQVLEKTVLGTSVLLQTPPLNFPLKFGHSSFKRHVSAAKAADVQLKIIQDQALAFDLDTLDDLRTLTKDNSEYSQIDPGLKELARKILFIEEEND